MVEQLMRSELETILKEMGADDDGDKDVLVARLAKLDADGSILRDWLSIHNDENTRNNRLFEAQTYELLKRNRKKIKNQKPTKSSDDDDDDEPQPNESELAEVLMMIELQEILGLTNRPIVPCKDVLTAQLAELDKDGSIVLDWLAKHNDECTRKCRILEAQQDAAWKRECKKLDKRVPKKKSRSVMSAEQVAELERQFAITRYPNLKELADLEAKLELVPGQIEKWFDDRREMYARMKKRMEMKKKMKMEMKKKMTKIDEDVSDEKSSEEMSMPSTSQDVGIASRVRVGAEINRR